jgi:hypothetical protein
MRERRCHPPHPQPADCGFPVGPMISKRRMLVALGLLLLVTSPIAAQVSVPCQSRAVADADQTAMNQALVVQTVDVDSHAAGGAVSADVHMQNAGGKAIAAYECRLLVTFDDGTQSTQNLIEDVLPSLAEARFVSRTPGMTRPGNRGDLFAGQVYTAKTAIRLAANGARPIAATGSISMVVYDDGTALGDAEAIALDDSSLNNYTIVTSSILYFQRNTTGAALISSKYW